MLTGANPTTAQVVADRVGGLGGIHAELKPEGKAGITMTEGDLTAVFRAREPA